MGISGEAAKDHYATMGEVSVDLLMAMALEDPEFAANITPEGEPKNPASAHDIAAYKQLYQKGKDLPSGGVPPVIIFCPKGHRCFIADGRHRAAAAKALGLAEVLATVIEFK